jgi:hypothetical protein
MGLFGMLFGVFANGQLLIFSAVGLFLPMKRQAFVSEAGRSIVVFDEGVTPIWDVPTTRMTPRFPIVDNPFKEHETSQIIGGAGPLTASTITTTRPWQSNPRGERMCVLSNETTCQKLYLLSTQDRHGTPSVVEFVKEAECNVADPNETFPTRFTGIMAGLSSLEEHIAVAASSDGGQISIAFLANPSPGTSKQGRRPPQCILRPLTDRHAIDNRLKDGQLGFCAASGRLVYLSRIGQLIISDYLAPPLD